MHRMRPKRHWTLQGQMYSHMCCKCPRLSNFSPFSLYGQPFFESHAILKKKYTEWPQMILNPTSQMYPICVLLVSTSLKFHFLSLFDQPFSRYRQIEASPLNDPKITLNLAKSNTSRMYYCCPRVSKVQSFSLYSQPFSSYMPFWDKCTESPKMTLNTTRS